MKPISSAVRTALFTAVTAVGLTASLPAQTASASDLDALREQIRLLDQKLRVLERNSELKEEAAVAAAKKQPVVSASDKGFAITAADKSFNLKFGALAQFDSRFFADKNGSANRDGFYLRRIRTPLTGTVGEIYDFNITPELGNNNNTATASTVGLIDAWFAARFTPGFGIKAGRFSSPVGLEPGANRHFIESPFVNTLLPNRDIGIEAFGTYQDGLVDYRLGVYSGVRNNTQSFSTDEADGDKAVGGRLTVAPFKANKDSVWSKLSLGLGGSVGNQNGVTTVGGSSALQNIVTNGQQTLLSFRNANTGVGVIAEGQQTRISPSIEWYTGTPWSFVAEYAIERQDYRRTLASADATVVPGVSNNIKGTNFTGVNTAWRLTSGYVLTGEEATKTGVVPASNFNFANGTWGAFELVGRVSGIDLDNKLFTSATGGSGGNLNRSTNASGAIAYGTGVNWYLNRNVRLLFDVEKTEFAGGGSSAATGGTRDDELAVFTRLQLQF